MKEPYLSKLLKPTIHNLEERIPQMIFFTDSEIDQQPWERGQGIVSQSQNQKST
jgi:hypothetical protein